jgi:four helix bundle protein
MGGLAHAESYRDLVVYQKARLLAQAIFAVTREFPREECYSLTDQFRRSSRSIGAQIAEAWAKRRYEKHFVSKLTDADGEQQETQHWIEVALDCGYLGRERADDLLRQCLEIGRLIGGMIAKAEQFCNPQTPSIRELPAEYFADH